VKHSHFTQLTEYDQILCAAGRWAEQNVIWTRQRKAWDSHKAEKKESKTTGK